MFVLIYGLVPAGEVLAHPLVVLGTAIASVPVATQMEKWHGHDASRIVIDEVVGMQVILLGTSPTGLGLVAVFFLFRLFDILKPFPAGRSQRLPGGWGVVTDDVVAGAYARVAMILAAAVWPQLGTFV